MSKYSDLLVALVAAREAFIMTSFRDGSHGAKRRTYMAAAKTLNDAVTGRVASEVMADCPPELENQLAEFWSASNGG